MRPTIKFPQNPFRSSLLGTHIADVLELAKPQVREKQLVIRLNLDSGVGGLACPATLAEAVSESICDAIASSPSGGEVTVYGVLQAEGLVVEISDDGSCDDARHCAFTSDATAVDGLRKATARFPQGGKAVSLIWRQSARRAMVA